MRSVTDLPSFRRRLANIDLSQYYYRRRLRSRRRRYSHRFVMVMMMMMMMMCVCVCVCVCVDVWMCRPTRQRNDLNLGTVVVLDTDFGFKRSTVRESAPICVNSHSLQPNVLRTSACQACQYSVTVSSVSGFRSVPLSTNMQYYPQRSTTDRSLLISVS